jgi:hypothetical protein
VALVTGRELLERHFCNKLLEPPDCLLLLSSSSSSQDHFPHQLHQLSLIPGLLAVATLLLPLALLLPVTHTQAPLLLLLLLGTSSRHPWHQALQACHQRLPGGMHPLLSTQPAQQQRRCQVADHGSRPHAPGTWLLLRLCVQLLLHLQANLPCHSRPQHIQHHLHQLEAAAHPFWCVR